MVLSIPRPGVIVDASFRRSGFIDSWRVVAVALVVVHHMMQVRTGSLSGLGELGVYIFFFISGFVVSKAALHEFATTHDFHPLAFYIRRVFRIIPPLLFYLLTCATLAYFDVISADFKQLLSGGLYVCNIALVGCGWYAGHTWSLAFEEQFYFLFPLLFLLKLRTTPSLYVWTIAAVVAALPAFLFPLNFVGRVGFIAIYALFAAGYWFARRDGTWRHWPSPNLLFIAAAIVTFFPAHAVGGIGLSKIFKAAHVFSIPVMVLTVDHARFSFRRLFLFAPIILVGQASYSIYLWQQLFTSEVFRQTSLSLHLLLIAMLVVACVALYLLVEKPLINIGRSIAARPGQAPRASVRSIRESTD